MGRREMDDVSGQQAAKGRSGAKVRFKGHGLSGRSAKESRARASRSGATKNESTCHKSHALNLPRSQAAKPLRHGRSQISLSGFQSRRNRITRYGATCLFPSRVPLRLRSSDLARSEWPSRGRPVERHHGVPSNHRSQCEGPSTME